MDNVQEQEQDWEYQKYFWLEQLESQDIIELISMFRNEYKPPQTLWIERVTYNMENSNLDEFQVFEQQNNNNNYVQYQPQQL